MIKKISTLFFLLIFSSLTAYAAGSPVPVLEKTANDLIEQLKQNRHKIRTKEQYLYQLVEKNILPLVDQERMARSVVDRQVWNSSNASQRTQFITQFRRLVLRTYAAAFSEYTNETIRFRPVPASQLQQRNVIVQSQIIRPGKPAISVDYSLARAGDNWKIYDFTVDGVSMVNSFRAQFASLNYTNLTTLINFLEKHNASRK